LATVDREAWQRFFLAVGGLESGVPRLRFFLPWPVKNGNVWPRPRFGHLSAGAGVGCRSDDGAFLARRVAAARVRDAFDYELTREEWLPGSGLLSAWPL